MKDIQQCFKRNERCAPAYFFAGTWPKAWGDSAGAQKFFTKCVQLAPDHVDAQRELRLMQQKK